ncbi:MAG: alpha/beta hydrolase [Lachnospiraceae bacterium]|nr:alpha/beta hydrolase [Lachnospiraceae bacterium]
MNYKIYNNNSNDWVLLIHGLGGSINTWKYQINELQKYNILAIDLAGHGGSPFSKCKHLLSRTATDINDILEKENIDSVHIISMSIGTIVALEFIYLFKEKVKSLILAGCVTNLNIGFKTVLVFVEAFKYIIPKSLFYPLFANILMPLKHHKKSRDFFIKESFNMKSEAFKKWLSEFFKTQFKFNEYMRTIREINLPVFFISGKQDYFFLNSAIRTHRKINSAPLKLIENCGHVCSIEKYALFNQMVLQFLNEQKLKGAMLSRTV